MLGLYDNQKFLQFAQGVRGVLKFYDTKTKKYFVTDKYKKVQLMTERGKKFFLKAKAPSGVDAFRLIGAPSSKKYIKTGD